MTKRDRWVFFLQACRTRGSRLTLRAASTTSTMPDADASAARVSGGNRTAALLALLAVCVAASGEPVPAWSGISGDSQAGTGEAWVAYFVKGLALDLLARHFEGIASAACCM